MPLLLMELSDSDQNTWLIEQHAHTVLFAESFPQDMSWCQHSVFFNAIIPLSSLIAE